VVALYNDEVEVVEAECKLFDSLKDSTQCVVFELVVADCIDIEVVEVVDKLARR